MARRLSDGSRQYSSGLTTESVLTGMEEELHDEDQRGRIRNIVGTANGQYNKFSVYQRIL